MARETPQQHRRPLVLIIDDAPEVIRMMKLELQAQGFDVVGAQVGDDTFRTVERYRPDAAIMEVVLPGVSGFDLLRDLKQRYAMPIIFVTTQGADSDRQYAMDFGADDYITRPFSPRELGQRIDLLLRRRTEPDRADVFRVDGVEFDLGRRIVRRDGEQVALSTNEWAIIYALAARRGRVVPPADLLIAVWGADYAHEHAYLELWIDRLRKKLEADPAHPRIISGNIRAGYALGAAHPRRMPATA